MAFKKACVLSLFLIQGIIYGQTDFREGYIIELSGDTVYGQIDYRGDLLMGQTCRFKKHDEIHEYAPEEIKAYRFIDSKYYVAKLIGHKKVFLEFLINGEVNIYYLRNTEGDHYFIEKEGIGISKIPFQEGMKEINGNSIYYESTKHIGLLSYYMQDAPEIKANIYGIVKPDHRNLINLAENYHNTVCEDESECIIYEKQLPLVQASLEPVLGIIKYNGIDKSVFEIGSHIYFWMPRANEKLYFKTGLLVHKLTFDNERFRLFKIPFQLQYLYPGRHFKPKLSLGANHYKIVIDGYSDYTNTVCLNAGFNYRLDQSVQLSASLNTDYAPLLNIVWKERKFDLVSYSFNIGLFIEL